MKQIQWFPGHMNRALREIKEQLKLVDLIVELRDARCPMSSANPKIKEIIGDKPRVIVLTKRDLADEQETIKWIQYFYNDGVPTISFNMQQDNLNKIVSLSEKALVDKFAKDAARGLKKRRIKAMVVGIPNVGKSTFINRLSNKKVAVIGNKPGVTKKQQWIRLHKDMDLMDTPGVLWPKFDNPVHGYNLAAIGSIKDDILPLSELISYVFSFCNKYYPHAIASRFPEVSTEMLTENESFKAMEAISVARNLLTHNGEEDVSSAERLFLHELRAGKLGMITFDRVENVNVVDEEKSRLDGTESERSSVNV